LTDALFRRSKAYAQAESLLSSVDLLIIKLILTPLLMWLVSYASRKWGTAFGGLLSGLPLSSGPVSIYLMIEQGRGFAAESAVSSLVSIGAVAMFSLAYGLLCVRQLRILLCTLAALSAFLVTIGALQTFHLSLLRALLLDLIMLSMFLGVIPKPRTAGVNVIYPPWDLPARMIAATSMVLLVTASARLLGPQLSGVLSPIPVLAWPLCIFVHVQQGSDGALAVLRGNLQGAYGVCVFYTVVGMLVRSWDPTLTYTIALLGSVLVSIPWLPRRQTARAA
jgi:hypothetical protein